LISIIIKIINKEKIIIPIISHKDLGLRNPFLTTEVILIHIANEKNTSEMICMILLFFISIGFCFKEYKVRAKIDMPINYLKQKELATFNFMYVCLLKKLDVVIF